MLKNFEQGLGIGVGIAAGIALFSFGSVCLKELPLRFQWAAYNFKLSDLEIKRNCPSPSVQCRSFDKRVKDSIQGFFASSQELEWIKPVLESVPAAIHRGGS